jgi:hypothetical protein
MLRKLASYFVILSLLITQLASLANAADISDQFTPKIISLNVNVETKSGQIVVNSKLTVDIHANSVKTWTVAYFSEYSVPYDPLKAKCQQPFLNSENIFLISSTVMYGGVFSIKSKLLSSQKSGEWTLEVHESSISIPFNSVNSNWCFGTFRPFEVEVFDEAGPTHRTRLVNGYGNVSSGTKWSDMCPDQNVCLNNWRITNYIWNVHPEFATCPKLTQREEYVNCLHNLESLKVFTLNESQVNTAKLEQEKIIANNRNNIVADLTSKISKFKISDQKDKVLLDTYIGKLNLAIANNISDIEFQRIFNETILQMQRISLAISLSNKTIYCIKGKVAKKVTGINPKCPTGFKKK